MSDPDDVEHFVPLLKLGCCLFVSVPAALRDSAARALQESVANRLAKERSITGLVIDVSALSFVDSFVAKVLGDIATIARSFGGRAVMVGMRPYVAMTLVDLGIEMESVETALSLEAALGRLKLRIVATEA